MSSNDVCGVEGDMAMENLSGVPSVGAWDLPQKSVPMSPFSRVCQG